MKVLKIELEEHAEVENELAKRSHFCNRVIQKYKAQVKMLQEEIAERQSAQPVSTKRPQNINFDKSDLT
jgi:hypothetical protein